MPPKPENRSPPLMLGTSELTPKCRWRSISGQVDDDRLTQAITLGGSADSETTEMTTRPERSSPMPAVMTLTLPTISRIAARKSATSTGFPSGTFASVMVGSLSIVPKAGTASEKITPKQEDKADPDAGQVKIASGAGFWLCALVVMNTPTVMMTAPAQVSN